MQVKRINNEVSFERLKVNKKFGLNVFEDFNFHASDKKIYRVSINRNNQMGSLDVSFKDNNYKCAEQQSQIYPEINFMYVDNMFTDGYYRGKGLGIGLHLTNIIEMLENKLKRIDLRATESAIPFHVHLGFKPDECEIPPIYCNLKCISDNGFPELEKFAKEAKAIITDDLNIPEKIKRGNMLIYDYAKEAKNVMSKEDIKYALAKETSMVLTKEDVINNKNFYNRLFDKYKIDYQI